jgi:phage terminase small subunit
VKLNDKQDRFAVEYTVDCNATQAAIRAGYSGRTAYSQGQRLLKQDEVKNRIAELAGKIESNKVAEVKEVMEFLTSVIRGETTEEVIVMESVGDGFSEAVIKSKRLGGKEMIKAAELLAKKYGLLTGEW